MKISETLSDKISHTTYKNCRYFIGHEFIMIEDVKEAIKKLKEDVLLIDHKTLEEREIMVNIILKIDKIFGDKLI